MFTQTFSYNNSEDLKNIFFKIIKETFFPVFFVDFEQENEIFKFFQKKYSFNEDFYEDEDLIISKDLNNLEVSERKQVFVLKKIESKNNLSGILVNISEGTVFLEYINTNLPEDLQNYLDELYKLPKKLKQEQDLVIKNSEKTINLIYESGEIIDIPLIKTLLKYSFLFYLVALKEEDFLNYFDPSESNLQMFWVLQRNKYQNRKNGSLLYEFFRDQGFLYFAKNYHYLDINFELQYPCNWITKILFYQTKQSFLGKRMPFSLYLQKFYQRYPQYKDDKQIKEIITKIENEILVKTGEKENLLKVEKNYINKNKETHLNEIENSFKREQNLYQKDFYNKIWFFFKILVLIIILILIYPYLIKLFNLDFWKELVKTIFLLFGIDNYF